MANLEAKWNLGSGWSNYVHVAVGSAPQTTLRHDSQQVEDPLIDALKEMKRISIEAIHSAMGDAAVALAAAHDNDIEQDGEESGDEGANAQQNPSASESPTPKAKKKRPVQ